MRQWIDEEGIAHLLNFISTHNQEATRDLRAIIHGDGDYPETAARLHGLREAYNNLDYAVRSVIKTPPPSLRPEEV